MRLDLKLARPDRTAATYPPFIRIEFATVVAHCHGAINQSRAKEVSQVTVREMQQLTALVTLLGTAAWAVTQIRRAL
jgi:hypothetical protein